MQKESSTIRVDPSNSTIGEGGQGGSTSKPAANNEAQGFLGKIKESQEESKVDKNTPPSQRLLSSDDNMMH